MISYSLVHHHGLEAFVTHAQEAGFSGAIVPDLPIEEAQALQDVGLQRDFKIIQLVTPTTPRDRAVRIARASTGFIYYVSVTGITGERDRLPDDLLDQIAWLRQQTDLPICAGFGISKPEHVRMLREVADGVIVGSAIVRRVEAAKTLEQALADVGKLARELIAALGSGG